MAEIKGIHCPKCGSTNVKRKKTMFNWSYDFLLILGGLAFGVKDLFILIYIGVMALKALLEIGFFFTSRKKWTWECKSCKKEFETEKL